MKATVLVDNYTLIDRYYFGEPGFSMWIEDGDRRILFDTGYSGIFMKNAELLGIDLGETTDVVLSHGHDDHTGGLGPFIEKFGAKGRRLIAHPDALKHKYKGDREVGLTADISGFDIVESPTPMAVSENVIFLGEIPIFHDFEPRYSIGGEKDAPDGGREEDMLTDDSAVVFTGKDGLAVITGCSHSGICNIIDYARNIGSDGRVSAVIGGFHLLKNDERTKRTVEHIANDGIACIAPCHCVCLDVKAELCRRAFVIETGVGSSFSFD